jgi:hypothetical protein
MLSTVQRDQANSILPRTHGEWRLGADGRFEASDIPPGTWDLKLDRVQVATVEMRSGEVTDLTIDATRLTRGSITGLVLLDGQPLANVDVMLWGSGGIATRRTGGDGRFTADGLPATDYAVRLLATEERCRYQFTLEPKLTLLPGGDLHPVFDFKGRPVRLRLLDPHGQPLPHREVTIATDKPGNTAGGLTDGDGWIAWPALPHGTLTLSTFPVTRRMAIVQKLVSTDAEWARTAIELEPLVVPPGRGPQVFERRLPAN